MPNYIIVDDPKEPTRYWGGSYAQWSKIRHHAKIYTEDMRKRGKLPTGGVWLLVNESQPKELLPIEKCPHPDSCTEDHDYGTWDNDPVQAEKGTVPIQNSDEIGLRTQDAPPLKGSSQSAGINAERLRHLASAEPFVKKGLRGLDVPSQRLMVSLMIGGIRQLQVCNHIIQLISVDVMNNLLRAKSASDVLLHDPSMLGNLAPGYFEDSISISIDAADATIRALTGNITEGSTAFTYIAAPFENLSATVKTSTIDSRHVASPLTESNVSGVPDSMSGTSPILSQTPLSTLDAATPRPWTVSVEEYEKDEYGNLIAGTICIYEINRMMHDPDWADSGDWDRDMANADLIVECVNGYDALLSQRDSLVGALKLAAEINPFGSVENAAARDAARAALSAVREKEAKEIEQRDQPWYMRLLFH